MEHPMDRAIIDAIFAEVNAKKQKLIDRVMLAVTAGVITQEQLSQAVNSLTSIGSDVTYDQALQVHNQLLGEHHDH